MKVFVFNFCAYSIQHIVTTLCVCVCVCVCGVCVCVCVCVCVLWCGVCCGVCVCVCVHAGCCFSILYTQTLHYTVTTSCCFFSSFSASIIFIVFLSFILLLTIKLLQWVYGMCLQVCLQTDVPLALWACSVNMEVFLYYTHCLCFFPSYCCILFSHLLCYCSVWMYGLVPACMCTVSMCMCTVSTCSQNWLSKHELYMHRVRPLQSRCHKCNELSLLLVLHLSLLQCYIFSKYRTNDSNCWLKIKMIHINCN